MGSSPSRHGNVVFNGNTSVFQTEIAGSNPVIPSLATESKHQLVSLEIPVGAGHDQSLGLSPVSADRLPARRYVLCPSGEEAVCKTAYAGSNPARASKRT